MSIITRSLVTGGAGFIGSFLCERLLAEGHEVIAVDNFVTGNRRNIQTILDNPACRLLEADITKPIDCPDELDFVFNFASPASPIDYLELAMETLEVGSLGTRNALELATAKGAVFIQASTSEVYGDPAVHPQTEDYFGNVNPIGPRSVYDEAKRFGEALTMGYHRYRGLDSRIVRIFNTYGPRMRPRDGRAIPAFLSQCLSGEPLTVFGNGSQTRSFCYVDDLVEGIWRLANSAEHLPVNLGNPFEMTILRLAEIIKELTGVSNPIEFKELPEDDPKVRQPDIGKAQRVLNGWQPEVGFDEGLARTVAWFEDVLEKEGSLD